MDPPHAPACPWHQINLGIVSDSLGLKATASPNASTLLLIFPPMSSDDNNELELLAQSILSDYLSDISVVFINFRIHPITFAGLCFARGVWDAT